MEVLLGITIVSVCLTLIIQSMSASLRAAHDSADYAVAVFLLEDKLNDFIQGQKIAAHLSQSGFLDAPFEKYQYTLTTESVDLVAVPSELEPSIDKINQVDFQMSFGKKTLGLTTYLFDQK